MGGMFSIIPDAERGRVKAVLAILEQGAFDEAILRFNEIIDGVYSNEAKAFGRYGAAVALMRRHVELGQGRPEDVDTAIAHYEACLDELKFGDAYLMLGMALEVKMGQLHLNSPGAVQPDEELLGLAERAVAMFEEVAELHPGLKGHAAEEIHRLEPIIAGLKERLVPRRRGASTFDQLTTEGPLT